MGRSRPTGDAHDRAYRETEKWGKKRWAWEFLRRNAKFMDACFEVDKGAKSAEAVARDFGLRYFKHCREIYKGDVQKPPKFIGSLIRCRARLQEEDSDRYKGILEVSEMVVVLRLEPCLYNTSSLDAQLRAVRRVATQNLDKLVKLRNTKLRKGRVTQRHQWVSYLRILDALANNKTHDEVALLIYEKNFNPEKKRDERVSFVKERIESARKMTQSGYLDVAFSVPVLTVK